jgi:hypothetical protein
MFHNNAQAHTCREFQNQVTYFERHNAILWIATMFSPIAKSGRLASFFVCELARLSPFFELGVIADGVLGVFYK